MNADFFKTGCFKKYEHLKHSSEIQNLFKKGNKVSTSGAKLFYAQNDKDFNRIGFPLSRGYGNAVERNMSRRYSRETYRLFKEKLKNGFDLLLLVYPGNDTFLLRFGQFKTLCKKAGLLRE